MLDFPLFYSIQQNFTNNGLSNDWRNLVGREARSARRQRQQRQPGRRLRRPVTTTAASISPTWAHAYTLMPGQRVIVYFNAKEFERGQRSKDGRNDALGGFMATRSPLVSIIRNSHAAASHPALDKETPVYTI